VEDRVRMSLEIESSDPMSGHLVDERGEVHTFRGWLELNSAIQALSDGGDPSPPERSGGAPDAKPEPGDHDPR